MRKKFALAALALFGMTGAVFAADACCGGSMACCIMMACCG